MSTSPVPTLRGAFRARTALLAYEGRAITALAVTVGALVSVLLTGVVPSPVGAAAADASAGWTRTTIDSAGDVSGLALDSGGDAHACWMRDGDLRYGTNATGAWVKSTLDTPGTGFGITYSSAIAVDHQGKVHIAYDGTEMLRYATNASGNWVVVTVDDPGFDVGDDVSIGLDSQDKLHACYLDRQNGHLRYATNASGAWVVSDLGAGGYIGTLAVDSNDKVHIVHNKFVGGAQLTYTTNASGDWATTSLGAPTSYHGSLWVDAAGALHLSYFTDAVYYATNASGAWVATFIDSDVGAAANSSLVLDSAGKAHVTYGDYGNGDLKYATNASGAWVVSVLDGVDEKGYWSSLAIDAADMLSVTYTDRDAGTVMFATTKAMLVCKSVASQDGWVRESAEGSGVGRTRNTSSATVQVGDDAAGRQIRTILTFNTSRLPDSAVVVSARIKLRMKRVTGTDPFTTHGSLVADAGSPGFGSSLGLKPDDFDAAPGFAFAGAIDSVERAGYHVTRIAPAALSRINRAGRTQFRLAFEMADDHDATADSVTFHSGNARASSNRPVLVVGYRVP